MPLPQVPSVLGPLVLAGRVAMTLLVGWIMTVGAVVGWTTDRVVIGTVVRIDVVRIVG